MTGELENPTLALSSIAAVDRQDQSARPQWMKLSLLAIGHFFADGYCVMVTPLLAYLGKRLMISEFWASGFFAAATLGASFSQPVWGYLSDRYGGRFPLILSPMFAAVVLTIGWTENYWLMIGLVFWGGMGTAMYHPVSGTLSGKLSEPHRAMGVALFLAAGMAGVGFFPVLITQIVSRTDLSNVWPLIIPAPLLSLTLWLTFRRERTADHPAGYLGQSFSIRAAFAGQKRAIALLFVTAVMRSLPIAAYHVAIPFMVEREFGDLRFGGYLLGLFSAGLGIGGIAGSSVARRENERFLLIFSLIASGPALWCFSFAPGYWLLPSALLAGAALGSTIPLAIAMGQRLAPRGSQMFNALMMGFAWGAAGLIAPLVIPFLLKTIGYGWATALSTFALLPAVYAVIYLPTSPGPTSVRIEAPRASAAES